MKKRNGFTLTELLAVVVIISFVSILVLPRILESFENKKTEISEEAKQLLYTAAMQYRELYSSDNTSCVTIGELINSGLLLEPVLDVVNNVVIPNDNSIQITYENNQYKYQYSETNCNPISN